jgi:hypothetical protein
MGEPRAFKSFPLFLTFHQGGAASKKSPRTEDPVALYSLGLGDVQRSLELHEADADAHKFCGILLARSAKDTKQKISNGFKIREHTQVWEVMIWVAAVARWGQWGVCKASVNVYLSSRPRWPCISVLQRAVELRPLDPVLHHMLGVWCFEVSNLGWVQRQLATALFGAPPTSTFEEALEHLQVTCVQVDASFLAHAAFPSSAELITLQRCEALACSPTSTTKPWMANRLKLAQTCIGTFRCAVSLLSKPASVVFVSASILYSVASNRRGTTLAGAGGCVTSGASRGC